MKDIRIIICDDSRSAASTVAGTVEALLKEQGIPSEIRTYGDPEMALDACRRTSPDLVFLDIEMPKMDGIVLGKLLGEMPMPPDIIYVSGREDRVFQALQVRPFGFVRKKNYMKDIADTMEAFIRHWQEKTDAHKLIVSTRDGAFGVPVASITYIECTAAKQQLFLSTQTEPVAVSSRMQKLEEELKGDGFIRIHKGYLVNHRWIDRITNDSVIMQNGTSLPVSRLKKLEVREMYLTLCRENGAMLF